MVASLSWSELKLVGSLAEASLSLAQVSPSLFFLILINLHPFIPISYPFPFILSYMSLFSIDVSIYPYLFIPNSLYLSIYSNPLILFLFISIILSLSLYLYQFFQIPSSLSIYSYSFIPIPIFLFFVIIPLILSFFPHTFITIPITLSLYPWGNELRLVPRISA